MRLHEKQRELARARRIVSLARARVRSLESRNRCGELTQAGTPWRTEGFERMVRDGMNRIHALEVELIGSWRRSA